MWIIMYGLRVMAMVPDQDEANALFVIMQDDPDMFNIKHLSVLTCEFFPMPKFDSLHQIIKHVDIREK